MKRSESSASGGGSSDKNRAQTGGTDKDEGSDGKNSSEDPSESSSQQQAQRSASNATARRHRGETTRGRSFLDSLDHCKYFMPLLGLGRENSSISVDHSNFNSAAVHWTAPSEQSIPAQFDTSSLLAKELNDLSLQERMKVMDDVHGVSVEIEETPELVTKSLQEMFEEVATIRRRPAYERAIFLNPAYVKKPEFGLQFLRAERFHPRRAAERMVRYFEAKMELFGLDKLVRDILYDDLQDEEKTILRSGLFNCLSSKDSAGRVISFSVLKHLDLDVSFTSLVRS